MDEGHAQELLTAERMRVMRLLNETVAAGHEDRTEANEPGDLADPAERLTAEEGDDAVAAGLPSGWRLSSEPRLSLRAGTFGLSIRSGRPIPDDRLEAESGGGAHSRGDSRAPGSLSPP